MSEWISIDDKMPEEGQDVLVFAPQKYAKDIVTSGYFDCGEIEVDAGCFYGCNITHWMPRPPAPTNQKESQEDK